MVAAPVTAPAAEPTVTPDANVLAREAIERLRGNEPAPRAQAKAVEPKVLEPKPFEAKPLEAKPAEPAPVLAAPVVPAPAPVAVAPSMQPLPPPIMVSTPPFDSKPVAARTNDPLHPTPPADIPDAQNGPLDLRADAAVEPPAKRPSVADDVLSATKKLFNSVIPK